LPQREPFLLLDRLTVAGAVSVGQAAFGLDCPFAQDCQGEKHLPTLLLLEALLQCGGAGLKQAGLGRAEISFLSSLERVKIRRAVLLPATIDLTARTLKAAGRIVRQSGEVHCAGQLVLSARWTCVYPNESKPRL